jgi:NitT/TauT family transport system substrate-binding protein
MPVSSNERPLETTTIRLRRDAGMCVAPWYVGEELLREGFTDIRYVSVRAGLQQRQIIGRGDRFFSRDVRRCLDRGVPITAVAGLHAGCFEPFAYESVP